MAQLLHLVFGGELVNPARTEFRDAQTIEIVGDFPNYPTACAAWKAEAQDIVGDARVRCFIARLHRLHELHAPEDDAPPAG